MDDNIISQFSNNLKMKLGLSKLELNLTNNQTLTLDRITVEKNNRKVGIGTEAMNQIIQLADRHNLKILLTPGSKGDPSGTTSRARLVKFYKRFGFVENKGRGKNYEYQAGIMYRPAMLPLQEINEFITWINEK